MKQKIAWMFYAKLLEKTSLSEQLFSYILQFQTI